MDDSAPLPWIPYVCGSLVFVVLIGGSVAVGYLFKRKGYSWWLGFLLSLIISPIWGAVIGAVLRTPVGGAIMRGASTINTKVCPHCAETIQMAAKKCRYCGSDLL